MAVAPRHATRGGRRVYPVNPMAVARYRDRHSVAGRKSDKGDAAVLANVLRTDMHAHRPLPADSELAQRPRSRGKLTSERAPGANRRQARAPSCESSAAT